VSSDYDIIIAGSGIAGSTLAVALADEGYRLAVVDPQLSTQQQSPTDELTRLRVSTIYAGELNALQRLGVWSIVDDSVEQNGQNCDFQRMHIWETGNRAAITFDGATIGQSRLGAVVENHRMVSALHRRLESTIAVLINAAVADISWSDSSSVTVVLESGEKLTAPLLVAADGTDSGIRRRAQIDILRRDYHQQAVVATVKPARHHQHTAWQKFLPTGPVALLPLAEGYCSIVWSTDPDHAEQLVAQTDTDFCRALGEVIDGKLGVITDNSARFRFPLFRQQAQRYIGDRIALIGDAAHRIHPLAGMGANLGITDALALAQVVADQGDDPGGPAGLNRYERWRLSEANAYIAAQEALGACYRWPTGPASGLRGLGVSLLDRSTIVKPELLLSTIGLSGNLPRLMRPLSTSENLQA